MPTTDDQVDRQLYCGYESVTAWQIFRGTHTDNDKQFHANQEIDMTTEELALHNGRNGQKSYVAVNGTIYDFTESALWGNGDHQNSHQAGRDLTEELKTAPHVRAVIERFPVVGHLEEAPANQASGTGKIIGLIAVIIIIAFIAFFALR